MAEVYHEGAPITADAAFVLRADRLRRGDSRPRFLCGGCDQPITVSKRKTSVAHFKHYSTRRGVKPNRCPTPA